MRHIATSNSVPQGGVWRYVDMETGMVITHPYLDQVRIHARKHRIANNLPIPSNWEDVFEDNVCSNTPAAHCEESDTGVKKAIKLAARFSTAMLNWTRSGFKLVDAETLAARRLTCEGDDTHERCPHWQSSSRLFGFGRCGKCGCRVGLKSALMTETCPLGKWPT